MPKKDQKSLTIDLLEDSLLGKEPFGMPTRPVNIVPGDFLFKSFAEDTSNQMLSQKIPYTF